MNRIGRPIACDQRSRRARHLGGERGAHLSGASSPASARMGSLYETTILPRSVGILRVRGRISKVPAMPAASIGTLAFLAAKRAPRWSGCSSPSRLRVPSGKRHTRSPFSRERLDDLAERRHRPPPARSGFRPSGERRSRGSGCRRCSRVTRMPQVSLGLDPPMAGMSRKGLWFATISAPPRSGRRSLPIVSWPYWPWSHVPSEARANQYSLKSVAGRLPRFRPVVGLGVAHRNKSAQRSAELRHDFFLGKSGQCRRGSPPPLRAAERAAARDPSHRASRYR